MKKKVNPLLERINQGEGHYLDFKHSINDAKKIARSLAAFANSKGGALLIGVKDNGNIKGVASEEEYFMVETAAHLFCRPEAVFSHKIWSVEGKNVLEIIIPEGSHKPYSAPDEKGSFKVYVRSNDKNIVADKIVREVIKRRQKNIAGIKIIYNFTIEVLLDYIENNHKITKTEFAKLANIRSNVAEKILINLILMNILKYNLSEKTTTFSFTDNFANNSEEVKAKYFN